MHKIKGSMKRYITEQQHDKSCGATSVANALKWLGYSASYRYIVKDLERAGFTPKKGMWPKDMHQTLKAYGIKYKLHKKPTLALMKKIVKNKNAMLFEYDWASYSETGGHFIFIDYYNSIGRGFFNAYNYKEGFETGMLSQIYVGQCLTASKLVRKNAKKGRKCAYVWEIIK